MRCQAALPDADGKNASLTGRRLPAKRPVTGNIGRDVVRPGWVNQDQTFRREIGGGFLWSPKRNRNGHAMGTVDPGPFVTGRFREGKMTALSCNARSSTRDGLGQHHQHSAKIRGSYE